jgi:transaldolase
LKKRQGFSEKEEKMKKEGTNPLLELDDAGQSIWLDYLSRDLMNSGELEKLIWDDGIKGVTSNPTIFERALSKGAAYDGSIQEIIRKEKTGGKEMFLELMMEDVKRAAGMLAPVFQRTNGVDGYVSIELEPDFAYDTQASIKQAERMFREIGAKNIFVKVPGTKPGLLVIEELIYRGHNINITLLFSVNRYLEVMDAYMEGLERRAAEGKDLKDIASVASFFVSRIDTLVDSLLDRLSEEGEEEGKEAIRPLYGKAAVANAKLAYKKYREIFSGERFKALAEKGARVQRILWASTSTKNPAYSDIKYIEELIAPDSINTMPEATLKAFKDHGTVRVSIFDNADESDSLFPVLRQVGVDIDQVTETLEREGVKLFSDSFYSAVSGIEKKRDSFLIKKSG